MSLIKEAYYTKQLEKLEDEYGFYASIPDAEDEEAGERDYEVDEYDKWNEDQIMRELEAYE